MYGLINRRIAVYVVAGFLSLVLSIYMSLRNDVINTDAICYLTSAAYVSQGIHAAMTVCAQAKWPFYAVIIHAIVSVMPLSTEVAAYILNAIFSLMTVLVFIGIIDLISRGQANKNIRILWLGALVILLSHEFNAVKQYIVRDHGFWSFYLLSLLLLMRFFLYKKWIDACGWSVSLIIATLFRIEGAVFLALIPLITWFNVRESYRSRFKAFLRLNMISISVVLILAVGFLIHPPESTGRLSELQFQLIHGGSTLVTNFQSIADFLAQHILRYSAKHDAKTILFLLLVVWYLYSIATNLSLIYSVLVVYAWGKKLLKSHVTVHLSLWSYVVVNMLITAVFLAQNMFLSKRYLVALSLVLMLWVPFALQALIKQWRTRKWPLVLAIFFMAISSVGGIIDFGPSKKYIHDAGDWLAVNAQNDAAIYSNDYQVMYYSQHFGSELFDKILIYTNMFNTATVDWKRYDYVALRVDKKYLSHDTGLLKAIPFQPVIVFKNKRGDEVRIYRMTH